MNVICKQHSIPCWSTSLFFTSRGIQCTASKRERNPMQCYTNCLLLPRSPPFRLPGWSVGRCSNCASRWGRGERSPPPPALVAKTTVGKAREKRTTVAVLPQQAQAKDSPQIVVMETPLNGYGSRGLTANIQIVVISDLRC